MQRVLIVLVRAYRLFLSPSLGSACRFTPTCSVFAIEALENHAAEAGVYLSVARLARCHPRLVGGNEPVPELAPSLLYRLILKSSRRNPY